MRKVNDSSSSDFARRLKDLLAPWKSYRAASEALGIPEPTLTRLARGANEPTMGTLHDLAKALNVSLSYLVGTSDEPWPSTPAGVTRKPEMDLSRVPHIDVRAAAGPGAENSHLAAQEFLPFPHWMLQKLGVHGRKLSFMRALGDSMTPTFSDGALLLVDESDLDPPKRAPKAQDGDIFVFLQDGALRTKRLRRRDREIVVMSDNRAYDPEILRGATLGGFKVIGRVVWWDDRL